MQTVKNSGFTLIEVLIAMVVLATGLLGLAGLQAASLKNNLSAYNRSQASQLAYDMSDRMRSNSTVASNYLSTFMTLASASVQVSCTTIAGCAPNALAENDLYQWQQDLTGILPGGEGEITSVASVYTITINWDDNRDGNIDATDPNFQMSFELL